ncbi:MAG: class I SAM-dependent methyltransferase [Bacteroidales bacterium]|nr:class I SAM-dependent methyltransferase [Bacteroidales bacterium]
MLSPIEKHYNKHKEDLRLQRRHGIVEFKVSMHYIHQYLNVLGNKSNLKILDVGAGTGRYTIELKNEGYDIEAVELVQHNIDIMLKNDPDVKVRKGDARDLSFIPDETYDMVILFGPLYHLPLEEDKIKALSEASRVTKKGGLILVAYLMNDHSILTYCFAENRMAKLMESGFVDENFHVCTPDGELYDYVRLEDIDRLNSKVGLERQLMFSPEGASDFMRTQLNYMSDENFALFVKYQIQMSSRPEVVGAGSHVVDIVKKD